MASNSKGVRKARRIIEAAKAAIDTFDNRMFGEMYVHSLEQQLLHSNDAFIRFMQEMDQAPVDIETFIDSPEFLGGTDLKLWPEVRAAIIEINRHWWKGQGHANVEAIMMGATSTGKCLPAHAEFLTPTGWKRMDSFEEGDTLCQYMSDGSTCFVTPTAYIEQENTQGFYRIASRSTSLQFTPNHRVIYRSTNGTLMEMPASSMVQSHENSAYGWRGKIPATFGAGGEGLSLSDDEIRLMVAVMADGSFSGNRGRGSKPNYCVFHVKKNRKKRRLRMLLTACCIYYNEYVRDDGFSDIAFLAPEVNKEFTGWWDASQEQLHIIRDELILWDGSESKNEFYTSLPKVADFIQYVGVATGSKTTINIIDRTGQPYGIYLRKSKEYTVRFHKTAYHSIGKGGYGDKVEIKEVKEHMEYCFTVPSGMFVARQDGCVYISGNSEISKVTTAYHLHIVGCLKNPQTIYGLPSATPIIFMIQAAKPHVTKKVIYQPLRNYVEAMPWFQKHMRPDRLIESEMYFPHVNVRVVQGGSDSDSVLGDAIIGGVIDEINFMNVVAKSKKAQVTTGRAGVYDQAQNVYDTITRRKKGRFLFRGQQVGVICVASSTRYKGDFTDKRKAHVEEHQEKGVFIYDKAQYEVWPSDRYCGDKFRICIENEAAMDIRILTDEQREPPGSTIFLVPVEYRDDFIKDAAGALRDVIGRSVNSVNPFFRRRHTISDAIERGAENDVESFLLEDNVILGLQGMPIVKRGHYCKNPSRPRYVHIDLSNTGDRCGIAMVRYDGLVEMKRASGHIEMLPKATVEMAVSIEPDHESEIDIAEIRSWVRSLKATYGYPIRAVTYDGWSSLESIQQWKKQGMMTGHVSVDRKPSVPYKQLRDAFNDGRIDLYRQDVLSQELYDLEYDEKTDKVDHPPNSSKDVADAVCGAHYTMLRRSSTWVDSDVEDGEDPNLLHREEFGDRFDNERHE
jgi:hypothetical protein